MSTQAVGGAHGDLAALAASLQKVEAGAAAVQEALSKTTGGSAAPIVSSSATAPGSLELFA